MNENLNNLIPVEKYKKYFLREIGELSEILASYSEEDSIFSAKEKDLAIKLRNLRKKQ